MLLDLACFLAFDEAQRIVAGVPWTFVAGTEEATAASTESGSSNCIRLSGPSGDYELDVTAGNASKHFTVHKGPEAIAANATRGP